MKYSKIIVMLLIVLLKNEARAIGTIETVDVVHFLYTDPVPTFDPGAYVKGAVYFDNGFELTSTATLQMGSLGVVKYNINLNNGTLQLTSNLYLGQGATITGPGFIDLNGYSILFSSGGTIQNFVFIKGFTGNMNGLNGNGCILSINGGKLINHGETVKIKNLSIWGIENYDVDTPNFQADILETENCTFSFQETAGTTINFTPSLTINENCTFIGTNQHIVCNQIHTSSGTLQVSDGTTLEVTGNIDGNTFNLPFNLILNNAHLEFSSATAQMQGTKIIVNGSCSLSSRTPLTIGDGSTGDCNIIISPASTLAINNNTTIIDDSAE